MEANISAQPNPIPVYENRNDNKFSILWLFLLMLIVALLSGGGVYLWQQNEILQLKTTLVQKEIHSVTTISPTSSPTPTSNSQLEQEQITSIDNTWNLYTNSKSGFSLKIPKLVAGPVHGNCTQNYSVPTVVFAENNGVYLTIESFLEYAVNNVCNKTTNTLSVVDQRANQWQTNPKSTLLVPPNWHLIISQVADDPALDQFIKTNWGSGCKLGTKTLSSPGLYDVKIQGDGLDLDQTKCPINFMVAVKYSPELKKAVTWSMGQSVSFSSPDLKQAYDEEIANSFKFVK